MKKNLVIVLILLCCIITGGLTACTSSKSDKNTQPGKTENTNEKVKLTALINKGSLTKDVNTMEWLKEIEEKAGVDIEWQQISADWDQKKPAMFASGEIPDLLFGATADSDYVQYNGLFEDLTSLISKDAPNIQQMFTNHPEAETMAKTNDGKIYGVSGYQAIWPKVCGTMFINKTWLDKLGLNVPTTWDEFEKVLIAFRDDDPNGNGKKDEIPMNFMNDFVSRSGGADILLFLGATGMQLTDRAPYGYFAEDATVKNCFTDDRYKDFIKFLRKLYGEGCISQEALTQDYSKYQSVCRSDGKTAEVGFTFAWESGDRFGNELKDQYISMPQLKENDDIQNASYSYDFYGLNYHANRVAMSSKCKNKDAAMKFIDAFYDEETSIQVLFGGMNDVDKGIKKNDDGTYEVLPPADSSIDPGTWKWTNSFADNGPFYIRDEMATKLKLGTDMTGALKEKSVYDDYLKNIDPKKNLYPNSFMKYSQDDINNMAMNQANIDNIVDQTAAAWLTDPSRDIDSEWDSYVKSVNDAGLLQNLEIRQKSYDEYLKTVN
jgi:putative aldouronate transport system substrate-binding protein